MATFIRAPTLGAHQPPRLTPPLSSNCSTPLPLCFSFKQTKPYPLTSLRFSSLPSSRLGLKFVPFAYNGETETTEAEAQVQEEDSADGAIGTEDSIITDEDLVDAEETPGSSILTLLESYKEALANNDESKITEVESLMKSIEEEKIGLEGKVASLTEELSVERDRILRISADFDNFRKRTERERLSLVANAQGEVVESLLSVLDNFERAKTQIKVASEGEEKINNSYQSIYKQFIEVLDSLGVEPVHTVGNPFDPLADNQVGSKVKDYLMNSLKRFIKFVQLHEAIMREESTEFEDGVIIEEFRKGFKLGDRLLRPSMVKVSAGPGPTKPELAAEKEQSISKNIEGGAESKST